MVPFLLHWGHCALGDEEANHAPVRGLAERRFGLRQDGQATPVTLSLAQPFLVLTPTLTPDGTTTTVRFTPQVRHGETVPDIHPAPDRHGWLLEYRKQQESYPDLGW